MKVALLALTLVNIALSCLGAMTAVMSPMMFDSGGTDDNLKWAIFWSILFFPVVALVCVFLPWLFVWLKWLRAALVASAIPAIYAAIVFALMSVMDAMRP
jgi:hypothetical protein